jgi:hypothetical protein
MNPKAGQFSEYASAVDEQLQGVLDNSTTPVTFKVGSYHGHRS